MNNTSRDFISLKYRKIFKHNLTGGWVEEQLLSSGKVSDKFGYSTSQTPDAKKLVIGAPYTSSEAGMVYFYSRSKASDMFQVAEENLSGFEKNDHLGMSVSIALDGSRFSVGLPGRGQEQGDQFCSVIVCEIDENDDTGTFLLPSNEIYGESNQNFGTSVALNANGTVVVVGVPSAGIVRSFT